MSRRRRVFDLDLPNEEANVQEALPAAKRLLVEAKIAPSRRGPMASAVHENAEALRLRAEQERAIRSENDALAEEFVRLKRLGLIVDMIPVVAVDARKLVRDRASDKDLDLDELKESIRSVGLSNPIRVVSAGGGRYELVQGLRRLSAYRALMDEDAEMPSRYARIPAGIMAADEGLETLYRRMVDENLIRKGVSFTEMAELARAYAADVETPCKDADAAVGILFQSAHKTKRSYIRNFVTVIETLGESLMHPRAIPRNLGVDLGKRLAGDEDGKLRKRLVTALKYLDAPTPEAEQEVLRRILDEGEREGEGALPTDQRSRTAGHVRRTKITFRIACPEGAAKCTAENGRIEIRLARDFTNIERRKLEEAVEALLGRIAERT